MGIYFGNYSIADEKLSRFSSARKRESPIQGRPYRGVGEAGAPEEPTRGSFARGVGCGGRSVRAFGEEAADQSGLGILVEDGGKRLLGGLPGDAPGAEPRGERRPAFGLPGDAGRDSGDSR